MQGKIVGIAHAALGYRGEHVMLVDLDNPLALLLNGRYVGEWDDFIPGVEISSENLQGWMNGFDEGWFTELES